MSQLATFFVRSIQTANKTSLMILISFNLIPFPVLLSGPIDVIYARWKKTKIMHKTLPFLCDENAFYTNYELFKCMYMSYIRLTQKQINCAKKIFCHARRMAQALFIFKLVQKCSSIFLDLFCLWKAERFFFIFLLKAYNAIVFVERIFECINMQPVQGKVPYYS